MRVASVIKRTKQLRASTSQTLSPVEKILSYNKVTGHSVNFPIYPTCKPSAVCTARCYYASGGPSWPASLKKQLRLYESVTADPVGIADRLVLEVRGMRHQPSFLRWNGGGDLFPASVRMLNRFASEMPELPIWVVTRRADQLPTITPAENVFIHFSLDKSSMERKEAARSKAPPKLKLFFSYQADKGEVVTKTQLDGISVLFYDNYDPAEIPSDIVREVICPLNTADSITGVCESCRRCFDGSAATHASARLSK